MNDRLGKLSDEIDLISEAQTGFRKGYGTTDNIFTLYALISIYQALGKKLYATFIDFSRAFDTIPRASLWIKLQKANITGKIFVVLHNLYDNVKSCVKYENEYSSFFRCDIGVRQGENLSPFLFALYLNDLEDLLSQNGVSNLEEIEKLCLDNLHVYIKIFVLLYADDTIVLAETPEALQIALDAFETYCTHWKLKINLNKTKVMIFCKEKTRNLPIFKLFNQNIQIVDSYSYLGVNFNYNCSFVNNKKKLVDQAQKAMYALYRKIRNISIPVDLQLNMFDTLIMPILTYGCEIWGFENIQTLEKIHLQFCRNILKVRTSTPKYMIYGELGRTTIDVNIKVRMISFWNKLLCNTNKLSSILYRLMLHLHGTARGVNFKYINYLKSIFDDSGLSYIWLQQYPVDPKSLKFTVKQTLKDHFIQNWYNEMGNSSKGEFYAFFKEQFGLENYLLKLLPKERLMISKLRCSNLKIPIELGRWLGIPKDERICHLCHNNIGNEFHYLFQCQYKEVQDLKNKYIAKYYIKTPNMYKLKGLLSFCNVPVLKRLSLFINKLVLII